MDRRRSYPPQSQSQPPSSSNKRLEDQQPSEAITSNRRPTQPPNVQPAPTGPTRWTIPGRPRNSQPQQPTKAGGWNNSNQSRYSQGNGNTSGGGGRDGYNRSEKGKERQWGTTNQIPTGPSSSSSYSRNSYGTTTTTMATRVPVPVNPRPKIFVSNLPADVTEEELKDMFAKFGTIIDIKIKPNQTFSFAHITYSTPQYATLAIESLNGKPFSYFSNESWNEAGSSRMAGGGSSMLKTMKVEYASTIEERNRERDRAFASESGTGGGGSGGGVLVTTTLDPEERMSTSNNALFRERETPDPSSQNYSRYGGGTPTVRKEAPSPIKSATSSSTTQIPTGPAADRRRPISPPPNQHHHQDYRHSSPFPIQRHLPPHLAQSQARQSSQPPLDAARSDIDRRIPPTGPSGGRREPGTFDRRNSNGGIRNGENPTGGGNETATLSSSNPPLQGSHRTSFPSPSPPRPSTSSDPTSSRTTSTNPSSHPGELQPDGTYIELIPLPRHLILPSNSSTTLSDTELMDIKRKQTLFRVDEVRKRSLRNEERVVLSSSIDGDYVSINFFVDDNLATTAPSQSASSTTRSSTSTVVGSHRPSRDVAIEEDVKPNIDDMEIDSPEPQSRRPVEEDANVVRFPMRIMPDRSNGTEVHRAAEQFIAEYYQRFDSARSSLVGFYTPNAFFSLKLDPTIPARLDALSSSSSNVQPTLFSRGWYESANKFTSTPTAITNAIRQLPAGSHDLSKIRFTAEPIPEFHLRDRHDSRRAPILLHLVGKFEEFPGGVLRRFSRTFVLVPRLEGGSMSTSGSEGGDFIVHSDQLAIGHDIPGEPRPLLVAKKPAKEQSTTSSNVDNASPSTSNTPPVSTNPAPHASVSTTNSHGFSPPPLHHRPHTSTSSTSTANATARPPPASHATATRRSSENTAGGTGGAGGEIMILSDTESTLSVPQAPEEENDVAASETREDRGADNGGGGGSPVDEEDEEFDQLDDDTQDTRPRQGGRMDGDDETNPSVSPELVRPPLPRLDSTRQTEPSTHPRPRLPANPSFTLPFSQQRMSVVSNASSTSNNSGVNDVPRNATTTTSSKKRKAIEQSSSSEADPPASTTSNSNKKKKDKEKEKDLDQAAQRAGVSREELQRLIEEQVAKQLESYLEGGGGGGSADGTKKKGKGKEKEVEEDRTKVKKKDKVKTKKKEVPTGLGTGLSAGDSRIIIAGQGRSILHGFDGRSNKLRGMVPTADSSSFLSVSFLGDIAQWALRPLHSMTPASITKLYTSTQDKYRVDDFSYNDAKDTLLVGYLGAKEGKEMECPPNQVVLYKRDVSNGVTKLVETRLPDAPHINGGVTAIMALPNKASTGRLRFVTGGEDKKVYLWTRQRSTQEVKIDKFRTEHTSMITSLAYLEGRDELVSGGKDRRVVTYDFERRQATWQATLSAAVMSVAPVVCDSNLILSRLATPSSQFLLHDRRLAATAPPVLNFGYDLPPHRSSNGTLTPTNMGRYPRGDQCDTVVAFPDHDQGVKLWDLRNLKSDIVKHQSVSGLGLSKVVQSSFRGRHDLCLMELSHFTRLSIKG